MHNYSFSLSHAFLSLYALLLTLSISLIALYTMRTLSIKKEIALMLYFQKQSMLYAINLKEIAIQCIKNHGSNACKNDSLAFDSYFTGTYMLSKDKIHDKLHNDFDKEILILDISIHAQTLLSTHPMRYAKRYILKGAP